MPAWRTTRGGASAALARRGVTPALGASGRLVLIAQVALSMIPVMCAGLFTSTVASLSANNPTMGRIE